MYQRFISSSRDKLRAADRSGLVRVLRVRALGKKRSMETPPQDTDRISPTYPSLCEFYCLSTMYGLVTSTLLYRHIHTLLVLEKNAIQS